MHCSVLLGVQAHGHDMPAHVEPRLPKGGALPQPVPEAGQSTTAQVSINSESELHLGLVITCYML